MDSFDQKIAELKLELALDSPSFSDALDRLEQCLKNRQAFDSPFDRRFQKEWKSSLNAEFITLLEAAVSKGKLRQRHNAVVVLGRIGAKESVEFLREIFERALIDDPLLLRVLVGEISWLTGFASKVELAERIANAENWTTRWVVFLIDPACGDELTETRLPEIQQQLVSDPHPIIATQTQAGDAKLFFTKAEQIFTNEIWGHGRYTASQLGDFIESFKLADHLA